MDSAVPEDGRKRKLPLWMLGVAAADKVSKPPNGDVVTEEEVSRVTQRHCPKRKARSACREKEVCVTMEEGMQVKESRFLVKCGTKRRRGVSRKDASCEAGENKKHDRGRKKVETPVPFKWKNAKSSGVESNDVIEASSPGVDNDDGDGGSDGDDLTMEDLMSIAKEFVENDNNKGQQQPSDGAIRVESKSADAGCSRCETGVSPFAPHIRKSPIHVEESYHHSSADNLTSKVIIDKPSMTGDPTQDMLDLFLGPLLKKPSGEEKKVSLVSRDITFAHEIKKQSQSVFNDNAPARVAKKKSSLKDKVAMFLD